MTSSKWAERSRETGAENSSETICPVHTSNYVDRGEGRTRTGRNGTMKRKRSTKVDRVIDNGNRGFVESRWTADAKAYMVTSVVVAFLLTVFAVLLPAAA